MHNLIYLLFAAGAAFAHSQDPSQARCNHLLGITIEFMGERPEDIKFIPSSGIGNRGLVASAWPPINAAAENAVRDQGVISWFHTIAVARNVDEARHHDETVTKIPYRQVMYLITDGTVDDLAPSEMMTGLSSDEKNLRRRAAQRRFAELFNDGHARIIYFKERRFNPHEHEEGEPRGGERPLYWKGTNKKERVPRDLYEVSAEQARLAFHPDEMGLFKDAFGSRFCQYGWLQLPMRGIMDFEHSFAPTAGGTPKSSFIKGGYNLLLSLVKEGWVVEENVPIDEAIELEKRTIHGVKQQESAGDGPAVANSRYLERHVEDMTRDAFNRGEAFTLGLRDPGGVLRVASIGFYGANRLIMMDCIAGMDAPKNPGRISEPNEKDFYPAVELRKGIIAAGVIWAREKGYPFVDTQTVSETTSKAKAYYIPLADFMAEIHAEPAGDRRPIKGRWNPPSYAEMYKRWPSPLWRPRVLPAPNH